MGKLNYYLVTANIQKGGMYIDYLKKEYTGEIFYYVADFPPSFFTLEPLPSIKKNSGKSQVNNDHRK